MTISGYTEEHGWRANYADCICPPGTRLGSYVVGCPYHIALHMLDGPVVAHVRHAVRTVTYYQAEVLVDEPILTRDGDAVATCRHNVTCKHKHKTPEAAEECARTLAYKAPTMIHEEQ